MPLEDFQPLAIRAPSENRLLFFIRCCVDLQLLTVFRFLHSRLACLEGTVLDIGAGESPWRELMPQADYLGVDIEDGEAFGMRRRQDITYYDGGRLPFPDESFDHVLCTEVLEHIAAPHAFLADLRRVLRPGGSLILTIPWSARMHYLPNDYLRFTRYGLALLLREAHFDLVEMQERGNDIAAIANKLIVWCIRLLRPPSRVNCLYTWPGALLLMPSVLLFLLMAHVSLVLHLGSKDDPLGYGVTALKTDKAAA
jgi:SAM-dependent methyltransferase